VDVGGCCVDNVLHAATLPAAELGPDRVWMLPPLRASMAEVVDGLARAYRVPARELVSYVPQVEMEERFGRLPETAFRASEAMGFITMARWMCWCEERSNERG